MNPDQVAGVLNDHEARLAALEEYIAQTINLDEGSGIASVTTPMPQPTVDTSQPLYDSTTTQSN